MTLAYALRYGGAGFGTAIVPTFYTEYLLIAALAIAIWSLLYSIIKLDGFSGGWSLPSILSQVLIGVVLLMSAILSAAFMSRQYYSRLILLYFGAFLLFGFIAIRCLMRFYVVSRSRNGSLRRVVILGNGRIARELAAKIERHPEMMKKVVGLVYSSGVELGAGTQQVDAPALAPPTNTVGLVDLLRAQKIDEIIVVHPKSSVAELHKLIQAARAAQIAVSLVPQWYELYVSRAKFYDVEGLPLLSLEERSPNPALLAAKRATDLIFAGIFLVLSLPILIVAAGCLLVAGQQPFRSELRCGLNGKEFSMLRLNVDRDAGDLTGIRAWLARLSLTELPQLWNVVIGNMTLVGPRPEPPERVKHYSDWQRQRLKMKPGLTGLAQVHGLREQHPSDEKARFDLQYILSWSPFLDLSLLLQTFWTVTVRLWGPAQRSSEAEIQQLQHGNVLMAEVVNADRTHAGAD
jgi:lipopolysaccharide/colanic/teichoic acid biosynthesis glycosyltransferase